jgi:DNA replication regulator DPB11
MDAAWIEDLSEIWKNDDEIDYRQLENKYQLKPLEKRGIDPTVQPQQGEARRDSLLICLTGFGDQRDEIAHKITSNGGLYTGDLTRRCTHLIVNKPEGKKYAAAKAWGIHPVTLAWLEQSVARRMILEETKFDPTLPPEEQGKGAWVTRELKRSLSKRSKSAVGIGAEEGPRKLRKTASMKLSSQHSHIWGDILGRSTSREYSFAQDNKPEDANPPQDQQQQPQRAEAQPPPPPPLAPEDQGIFTNCFFYIHGFTAQRTSVLEQTLVTLGASICSSLHEAALGKTPRPPRSRFLIVPQASQPDTHPQESYDNVHVVTEYYIEKCLHNKQCFDPTEHVLGRPFPFFPIPAFADLVICSAAFTGIELNQVARAAAQLGAKFDGEFRKTTSVLICKDITSMRKEKLRMALKWGVPVVSADWFWECISTGFKVPLDDYIFPEIKSRYSEKAQVTPKPAPKPVSEGRAQHKSIQRTHSEPAVKPTKANLPKPPSGAGVDTTGFDEDSPEKPSRKVTTKSTAPDSAISADFATARTHQKTTNSLPKEIDFDALLAEVPQARLNRSPSPTKQHTALPRTRSDPTSKAATEPQTEEIGDVSPNLQETPFQQTKQQTAEEARLRAKAAERQALSSKLTSLIETTTPNLPSFASDDTEQSAPRPRKRQLFGRAISNASNTSSVASRSAAELHDVFGDEDKDAENQSEPPATQLEYRDDKAKECRAALMSRMMGGSGEVKPASTSTQNLVGGGTRTLRKR